jgi:pyruvate dehydrogenase E2 component (dihydrolipoamide acetyltransferase)
VGVEEVKLPELGENIETADVAAVLVAAGDTVRRDQPVIEVETEKASLEVPSTCDGRVAEVRVKRGDKVAVGDVILVVEAVPAEAAQAPAEPQGERRKGGKKKDAAKARVAEEGPQASQTAAGPRSESESDERPEGEGSGDESGTGVPARDEDASVVAFPRKTSRGEIDIGEASPAAPSVRALARELGVDIADVPGSGPGGRISRDDVKAHVKRLVRRREAPAGGRAGSPLPDFTRWGEVDREPLGALRRATAEAMATSWATIPQVTQFDRADITQLDAMRRRFNERPEASGHKLGMTAIAVKIVAAAQRQFPRFNASLDTEAGEVVYKRYVNIGVAVDTERGLLVPVVREADRKSLLQIAGELTDLAERARSRKLKPEEMRGATSTVSNLGGLGTTHFSPIVNWPECAILGIGRAEARAVHEEGRFTPRLLLPLSLSYDHRLNDGADAARYLRWVAEALEQPLLLLIEPPAD